MRNVLLAFLLTVLSTSAFAKLNVFKNVDAVRTVLSSTKTMAQIIEGSNDGELTSIGVSKSGEGVPQKFTVRVKMTTSNLGLPSGSCITDVTVASVGRVITAGGGRISTNALKIKEVSATSCQRQ